MNLFEILPEYNKSFCNSNETNYYTSLAMGSLISKFFNLLTGFKDRKILLSDDFNRYWSNKNENFYLSYNVGEENKYQYNGFLFDKNMQVIKVNGDGGNEIRKIFKFIEYWNFEDFLKWKDAIEIANTIAYWSKIDEKGEIEYNRTRHNSFISFGYKKKINLDENTFKKYDKLNELHQNLLFLPIEKIAESLAEILPYWEPECFKKDNPDYWDWRLNGSFSNNEIPNIKIKKVDIIIFPEDRRGSICSNFIVLPDTQMNNLLHMEIGKEIKLKHKSKGGKIKQYEIIEHRDNFSTALKNLKSGKLEFATHISTAENCYDALFDCNKRIYNSWYRKKYSLVK